MLTTVKDFKENFANISRELFPGTTPYLDFVKRRVYREYGITIEETFEGNVFSCKYTRLNESTVAGIEVCCKNKVDMTKKRFAFHTSVLENLRYEPKMNGFLLDEKHYSVGEYKVSKDLYLKSKPFRIVLNPNSWTVVLKVNENKARIVRFKCDGGTTTETVYVRVCYK